MNQMNTHWQFLMMKPEAKFSNHLTKIMKPYGSTYSFIKVETGLTISGVPDRNYAYGFHKRGWIELKCLPKMPKRQTTLSKWTALQRLFAIDRGKCDETVLFFLKAGDHYLLFDGYDIARKKSFTPDELIELSIGHWEGKIDAEELYGLL